jgi:hypothetical protein
MRYSATARGFFPETIEYPSLPVDLVEITDEYHRQLMDLQATGAQIVPDGEGIPQAVFPPPPDPVVPAYVRKLALVRALRMVGLDGDPDNPVKAWPTIRAAIDAADADTQEDWALASEIPRNDPALALICQGLNVSDQVLDAVFIMAAP